jgi:hypothetical protein
MLRAFTNNHADNSTEAGFEFTFFCDNCRDGYKSSFIESATYKKRGLMRGLSQGASILGSFVGGRAGSVGYTAGRGMDVLGERFNGMSPEWQKEHEAAFERAQAEAMGHFHRCHNCAKYVCDACFNEAEGLCVACAPRQDVYVAQARAAAMKRNIDSAGQSATVWQGTIESKTTQCPTCGKPAGDGKFCANCGTSMARPECATCGEAMPIGAAFCSNCGTRAGGPPPPPAAPPGLCAGCGTQNTPGAKFCGGCGSPLAG